MPQVLPVTSRETSFCASDGIYARQAGEYTKFLQTYDKDLIAKWLPDKFRWSVWTRDKRGHAYLCYECVDPVTKGFRHIGQVDFKLIGKMDRFRKEKMYSLLKEVEDNNTKLTLEHKKQLRSRVEDSCRDRWRQFSGNKMIQCGIAF